MVIVAGGVREELQRAFLLHRFRIDLGQPWMGVFITSLAFGMGHTLQGLDAAIVTGAARRDLGRDVSGARQRRRHDGQPLAVQQRRTAAGVLRW